MQDLFWQYELISGNYFVIMMENYADKNRIFFSVTKCSCLIIFKRSYFLKILMKSKNYLLLCKLFCWTPQSICTSNYNNKCSIHKCNYINAKSLILKICLKLTHFLEDFMTRLYKYYNLFSYFSFMKKECNSHIFSC